MISDEKKKMLAIKGTLLNQPSIKAAWLTFRNCLETASSSISPGAKTLATHMLVSNSQSASGFRIAESSPSPSAIRKKIMQVKRGHNSGVDAASLDVVVHAKFGAELFELFDGFTSVPLSDAFANRIVLFTQAPPPAECKRNQKESSKPEIG